MRADADSALRDQAGASYDLLVLSGMSVDQQQELADAVHKVHRWRLVPILYVQSDDSAGLSIPGSYRPEVDSIVRGALASAQVQRRIRAMAREGVGDAELVIAGGYELDPIRSNLHMPDGEVSLTEREAEILAMLLSNSNRTVTADEIIERGWGVDADVRHLQILRRHVSNIRRKLDKTLAEQSLHTVRGSGYRFDTKSA
jgi:two-component system OmpR family response regulator